MILETLYSREGKSISSYGSNTWTFTFVNAIDHVECLYIDLETGGLNSSYRVAFTISSNVLSVVLYFDLTTAGTITPLIIATSASS